MQNRRIVITALAFLLLVNTKYYWAGNLGTFGFPVMLLLAIIFLGLIIAPGSQIYLATKETFSNKSRLFIIGLLTIVLALTFYKPGGLIGFE